MLSILMASECLISSLEACAQVVSSSSLVRLILFSRVSLKSWVCFGCSFIFTPALCSRLPLRPLCPGESYFSVVRLLALCCSSVPAVRPLYIVRQVSLRLQEKPPPSLLLVSLRTSTPACMFCFFNHCVAAGWCVSRSISSRLRPLWEPLLPAEVLVD